MSILKLPRLAQAFFLWLGVVSLLFYTLSFFTREIALITIDGIAFSLWDNFFSSPEERLIGLVLVTVPFAVASVLRYIFGRS